MAERDELAGVHQGGDRGRHRRTGGLGAVHAQANGGLRVWQG